MLDCTSGDCTSGERRSQVVAGSKINSANMTTHQITCRRMIPDPNLEPTVPCIFIRTSGFVPHGLHLFVQGTNSDRIVTLVHFAKHIDSIECHKSGLFQRECVDIVMQHALDVYTGLLEPKNSRT